MVPAGPGGGGAPPDQVDHCLPSSLAGRRPRGLGPLHEALRPGDRVDRVRLDRGSSGPMDLLAWGCPSRALAEAAGADRRAVGEARVASPVDSPGVAPGRAVAGGVLSPDLGRDPGPVAGSSLSARAVVFLRQLRALWRVHQATRAGRPPRRHCTYRRSRRCAAGGIRGTLLAKTTLAVARA